MTKDAKYRFLFKEFGRHQRARAGVGNSDKNSARRFVANTFQISFTKIGAIVSIISSGQVTQRQAFTAPRGLDLGLGDLGVIGG